MYLAVVSSKLAGSSNSHECARNVPASAAKLVTSCAGRRGLLLSSTVTTILAAAVTVEPIDSKTALLQKYLKKSEENKERNDKEVTHISSFLISFVSIALVLFRGGVFPRPYGYSTRILGYSDTSPRPRVENYYKRNYKDYFGFVEGTLRAKDKDQLSESERGILEWLDKNK